MIPIHRCWLLVIAVVLAVVFGPPTHAQPSPNQIESSFGRGDLPPIVGMTGESFTVEIIARDTVDFQGLQFVELVTAPGGRVTVMADGDLPLAKALRRLSGRKVRLSLNPVELGRLDR